MNETNNMSPKNLPVINRILGVIYCLLGGFSLFLKSLFGAFFVELGLELPRITYPMIHGVLSSLIVVVGIVAITLSFNTQRDVHKRLVVVSPLVVLVLCVFVFLSASIPSQTQHMLFAGGLDWKRGLAEGQKLQGTDSPDGNYALFWIHPVYDGGYATTQTAFVIGSTDRERIYGLLDSRTENITVDEFIETVFTYQWSPDVCYLATHNPTTKHSQLYLYDIRHELNGVDEHGNRLAVPDLTVITQQSMGISGEVILSSGQVPVEWLDTKTLKVRVRLKTHKEMIHADMILHISEMNKIDVVEQ